MTASADSLPLSLSHDRLGFSFCLALALHAALILGISFNREDRSPAATKLEITLAQQRAELAPEEADFLAQQNQQGSGTLAEKAIQTTVAEADFVDNRINDVTPTRQARRQQQQDAQTRLITTRNASQNQVSSQQQADTAQQQQVTEDAETARQRQREIASLEARLDIQRQAYAKRPRIRRLTSVSARQAEDALYLHNWRSRVEAVGNQHYPAGARQQNIVGELRLMVALLPNGAVHRVKILESSGHKMLDEAAIRIVHLAAPYEPFPALMRRKVDVLEIIRTWRFHRDGLSSSS